jgi:Rrf2 family protein
MRLSVTRRSDLAIRAIRALSDEPKGMSGPDLASAIGSTHGFVAQIMLPLVRRRWVASTAGRSGGYRLLEPGRRVSVLDVIEAIEGPTAAGHPLGGNEVRTCVLDPDEACALAAEPGRPTCDLHDAWLAAERTLIEQLRARPVLAARAPDPSSGSQS